MTARQSFKTAAARRRAEPLIFALEDTPTPGETSEFRIDPNLDVATFGSLFATFMTGAKVLPMNPDGTPAVSDEEVVAYLADLEKRASDGQDALAGCVVAEDRERFNAIKSEIDIHTLVGVTNWLSGELTGRHPTLPGSSSDGSSETGMSSMGGSAPTGPATPLPSPLPPP